MYVKELQLVNYRNYSNFSVTISEGLNFIIGRNAAGKTNLLEAIYFLENGRSHRTSTAQELIKWNEEFAVVRSTVQRLDRELLVEASIFIAGTKQLKVNGVASKKEQMKARPVITVIFTPDHLKIVKEMPDNRRAYLDEILEKTRPDYAYRRQQYSKILKQRNMLLKKVFVGRMKADVIDYWDKQLVEAGSRITIARRDILYKIEERADQAYKNMTESDINFSLSYENQLLQEGIKDDELEERFLLLLREKRKAEIERGQTLVGPHRDDVGIFAAGIDLRTFGSQGEQRSAALALKMAELSIITELTKDQPVLLLDDVMSELDRARREALLKHIEDGVQVIVTSTNVEYLKEMDIDTSNIIKIG